MNSWYIDIRGFRGIFNTVPDLNCIVLVIRGSAQSSGCYVSAQKDRADF
jgi:hypothetical protein